MIPIRGNNGKFAKSVFYHDVNDIDIYVEDTAKGTIKLYTNIFSRVFDGIFKVYSVFPLGGRDAVVDRCKQDNHNGTRINLYVIDGDLFLLNGENIDLDGLLVLDRYAIENYLIDEASVVDILLEEDLEMDRNEIEVKLNYSDWINANSEMLFDLFVVYSLVKKNIPEVKTVSYKVSSLVSNDSGEVCTVKIANRIRDLELLIIDAIGADALSVEKSKIINRAKENNSMRLLKYVSGKDYLLALLLTRMRKIVKIRSDNKVIKQRLSGKCNIESICALPEIVKLTSA